MTSSIGQVLARPAGRSSVVREALEMVRTVAVHPLGLSPAPQPLPPAGPARWAPAAGAVPVVLVHGFLGNRSSWFPLQDRLEAGGFPVHAATYARSATDLEATAIEVVTACRQAMWDTGSDVVHVVGHSLGGLVLRYALHVLDLAEHVGTAVTIASPHGGAPVARLGRGTVVTALRPRSALLAQLDAAARSDGVRWVSYWSDSDVVVPGWSARLTHRALQVEHRLVPEEGHLSILRSPALLAGVPQLLLETPLVRTA